MASLLGQNSVTCLNPLEKNDPSRRVCLYGKDLQPIVITKSGAVLISSDRNLSWQNVLGDHRFTGLGLLEMSHNRKSVAVTSSSSDVVVLSKKEIGSLEELGDWILPFSKQRWTTSALWIPFGAPPGIILCGNRSGDLLLYQGHCKNPLQVFRNVHGHMGVTSFLLLNYKNNTENIKADHWVPSYSEMYIHCQHSNNHEIERNAIIYSTGRDGVLKSYVIRDGHLKIRGCEQLGFEWAARCFVLNGKIFVFGFKGAYAVVWGVQERSVLLEKECGGGHRSWDLDFTFTAQETLHLRLALIKNGKLSMVNWETPSDGFLKSVLLEGLHSKEVYCVKWLDMMTMKVSGEKISAPLVLISGSEDTTAKINHFCPTDKRHSYELSTINALCGHLSSIRTLSLFPLPQSGRLCDTASEDPWKGNKVLRNEEKINVTRSMNFLVFTAGGRAQLKVWKLCFDVEDQGESGSKSYVNTCRVEEKASLLLGTRKYGEKEILTDPEARFMEVCAFCSSKTADGETLPIALAAACSDGILRIFGYPESQNKGNESRRNSTLRLHSEGFPHCPPSKRHCLFRVSHRMLHDQHLLITTDTMGYFHLWDVTPQVNFMKSNLQNEDLSIKERSDKEKLEPFFTKLVHRFSINALDWLELSSGGSSDANSGTRLSSLLLLATGGEDGTLALNILRLTRERLKFIGNKYLVTVSKGQQVALWSWKCNLEDFSISASIVHQYFTSVADVQDIEVIETMNGIFISICGCGIEVIRFTIPKKEE
ncbi:hypothetical protein J437_LFUL017727 [Ladona fulva]|uniref:WD repeat-containing protein 6 n=1 Tax=Ladona fulva TaxID=123851 RepID=A0A8K0P3K5_LADFU|nr:hypothetical protein J437_LFUL017727 [Ladona fulva]